MAKWDDRAACVGADTNLFYDYTDDGPDGHIAVRERFCARCPVRRECLTKVMADEAGSAGEVRFGVVAGLTPGQRLAVERRGCQACPECGATFDPAGFLTGELFCEACDLTWTVRPLPERGDAWFDRHTALGERVVTWLIEHTQPGDVVPQPTTLGRDLSARKGDMVHVYDALVYDGTLSRTESRPPRYVRLAQAQALRCWTPPRDNVA